MIICEHPSPNRAILNIGASSKTMRRKEIFGINILISGSQVIVENTREDYIYVNKNHVRPGGILRFTMKFTPMVMHLTYN